MLRQALSNTTRSFAGSRRAALPVSRAVWSAPVPALRFCGAVRYASSSNEGISMTEVATGEAMKDMFPGGNQQGAAKSWMFADDDVVRRRLLYSAKQRGYLELDILLGRWATDNLSDIHGDDLKDFAFLLTAETPDLFKWLTGQEDVPEEFRSDVCARLVRDCRAKDKSNPATRSEGWYDKRGANGQNWN